MGSRDQERRKAQQSIGQLMMLRIAPMVEVHAQSFDCARKDLQEIQFSLAPKVKAPAHGTMGLGNEPAQSRGREWFHPAGRKPILDIVEGEKHGGDEGHNIGLVVPEQACLAQQATRIVLRQCAIARQATCDLPHIRLLRNDREFAAEPVELRMTRGEDGGVVQARHQNGSLFKEKPGTRHEKHGALQMTGEIGGEIRCERLSKTRRKPRFDPLQNTEGLRSCDRPNVTNLLQMRVNLLGKTGTCRSN